MDLHSADGIAGLFTRDGHYLCARWGRPVAPVVFGLADDSLALFRAVTAAVLAHARHPLVETDPEMGANMLSFFLRDWDELKAVPDFDRLVGQPGLPERLKAQVAGQYRVFRFDADGAIRACISLINVGGTLAEAHPGHLAETLAVRAMLTFARDVQPSAGLAQVIRAAYDPALPMVARDASHALRLAARVSLPG
jgi:hypothetical protein